MERERVTKQKATKPKPALLAPLNTPDPVDLTEIDELLAKIDALVNKD